MLRITNAFLSRAQASRAVPEKLGWNQQRIILKMHKRKAGLFLRRVVLIKKASA